MEQARHPDVAADGPIIPPSPASPPTRLPIWAAPDEFIDITGALAGLPAIERALGYFGHESYVLFAYEPRGGEVVWKDGHSCGFAHGAWDVLAQCIAPIAERYGASLGGEDGVEATHVLVIDRSRARAYLAETVMAEVFFCAIYGFSRTRFIDTGSAKLRNGRQITGN